MRKSTALMILSALFGVAFSLWFVCIPIFAYLAYREWVKRRADERKVSSRTIAALISFVLAVVAAAEGGTWSIVFFSSVGVALLASRRLAMTSTAASASPVPGTILLRSGMLGTEWHAAGEVKLATADVTRALSAAEGNLVVDFAHERFLLILSGRHLRRADAERDLLMRMRKANRILSRSGSYLLPLDSTQTASELAQELVSIELDPKQPLNSARSLPIDLLSLACDKGLVSAAGAYLQEGGVGVSVPNPNQKLETRLSVWEVLEVVKRKQDWTSGDGYASLLASVWAARREPPGEILKGEQTTGGTLLVKSHASAAVPISPVQLRALLQIYPARQEGSA